MHPVKSRLTTLLGTASFVTLAGSLGVQAQSAAPAQPGTLAPQVEQAIRVAQADQATQLAQAPGVQVAQGQMVQAIQPFEIPEQVLITGSLIRGTAAVGVPVINVGPQDFRQTGALTTSDLFRSIPQFNVNPGPVATQAANVERGIRVNLRQLDTGSAPRSLMMVDGVRYPPQGNGLCQLDPSIIPSVAIERIDLLLDGASATYGSDAIGGVINIIMKRNYDGAVTELGYTTGAGGNQAYQASQLWGRTWDGGGITLGYEWRDVAPTRGNFHSKFTFDHTPWGLDNRIPLGSSIPGTISTGAPLAADEANYPATLGTNCLNCWAIPGGTGADFNPINGGLGPLAAGSAPTLAWNTSVGGLPIFNIAGNRGVNGTRNIFNPYDITYYSAAVQYNGAFVTIDQQLTSNISFFGSGLYGNRRSQFINNIAPNQLIVGVPTWNPYYPAGGAPTNLRVAYTASIESPSITNAYAIAQRYLLGLNIDLPNEWAAQVYYSMTRDSEFNHVNGTVNKAAVSAALGWTMARVPAVGTTPGFSTWVKPATIPYMNLFCDPRAFECNPDTTLRYVQNFSETFETFAVNEKGIKADGPIFDLPGGQVKAAIGANFTTYHFLINRVETSQNLPVPVFVSDPQSRQVWATFAQINIPVIGEANALPFIAGFELEGSWRHDQYSDVGGTSNSKVAFNWNVSDDWGLVIRGGWGSSFRAHNFGEFSQVSNIAWQGYGLGNAPGAAQYNTPGNATISIACQANGAPPPGSGAEKLFNVGFGCNSQPAGISLNGGGRAAVDANMREYFNQTEQTLDPEKSINYAIGFDFAPTAFLPGLDIQATWYSVKINGILRNFGNPTTNRFNDGSVGFVYLTPSDVGCPVAQNSTPQLCANFQDVVQRVLSHATNPVPSAAQTLIYWINDGGVMNKGWQKNTGYDASISYDWDMGNLGAWNVGVVGTYYQEQLQQAAAGGAIEDGLYHTTIDAGRGLTMFGVESRPRLKYRARLGWADGAWSVTGFMDYEAHFFHTQPSPPNVNANCLAAGGTLSGGTFPCAINNYTNIQSPQYLFDLSIGYDTGDSPTNEYMRNIGIQLVVQNLFDKVADYQYRTQTGGGNPCACNIIRSLFGRTIQVRVVKTW